MKIRAFLASGLLALSLAFAPAIASTSPAPMIVAAAASIPMFDSEAAAQAHCPKDVVVWLNIPSGIYHEKGMRWYGRTRHGASSVARKLI